MASDVAAFPTAYLALKTRAAFFLVGERGLKNQTLAAALLYHHLDG